MVPEIVYLTVKYRDVSFCLEIIPRDNNVLELATQRAKADVDRSRLVPARAVLVALLRSVSRSDICRRDVRSHPPSFLLYRHPFALLALQTERRCWFPGGPGSQTQGNQKSLVPTACGSRLQSISRYAKDTSKAPGAGQ